MSRNLIACLALGWAGVLLLPWYALDSGAASPLLVQAWQRPWLAPLPVLMLLATLCFAAPRAIAAAAAAGLLALVAEALVLGMHGWNYGFLASWFGAAPAQPALGWGAIALACALVGVIAIGLARRGVCKGDVVRGRRPASHRRLHDRLRRLSGAVHPGLRGARR